MNMKKFACVVCGMALAGTLVAGCGSAQTQGAAAPTPAQTYIASVHETYNAIEAQMETLAAPAASGDAAAVFATLDKVAEQVEALEKLKVPAGLEQVQEKYVTATKTLSATVRQYADYRMNGGAQASDAAAKLDSIKEGYATGIKLLKEADALAKTL